ncbi:hypothetical protein BMETH_1684_0 [methanotrophic bacterial endosymbiont of Bathymodiolus sp.]|nr:hypothetical protein BMETH_1684_0 [methanotrophic bacterial endosymbiont of Bathymodiolus sp.]
MNFIVINIYPASFLVATPTLVHQPDAPDQPPRPVCLKAHLHR